MHIAQLSVAGEAVFRLETSEPAPIADDRQALDEYACDRSNLPWVIFRAAHRATHISALPARARALLAALARTVDAARPYASIFARRELLTGRAQQSMRTFYRGLDDLETTGFIVRPPQTRYGAAGLFGRAYLHLTPKAAVLLGLVDAEPVAPRSSVNHRGVERAADHPDSFAPPSVTVADGAIYKDLIPTSQKRQPGRLPVDLKRLLSLGFREFLVFKLMREAKLQGKLLSDVVEASWVHLNRAKHPISYLRALLRAPVDFAYRVRSQHQARVEEKGQQEHSRRVDEVLNNLEDRSFVSRDGMRRYRIADDLSGITVHHRDENQPRIHAGAWARDFVAALEAGHIVPVGAMDASDNPTLRAALTDAPRSPWTNEDNADAASKQNVEGHLRGLKEILRLKRAQFAPSLSARETENSRQPALNPSPLRPLLLEIARKPAVTRSDPARE